jgi:crossover junction endodeoxyribonuclease RuvC
VIVLGIDPGTLHLGWGVVSRDGNRLRHVAHGIVRLNGKSSLAVRLCQIDQELSEIVQRYRPDGGSVEGLFFNKDAQAASKLGHARGVVLLTLSRSSSTRPHA